MGITRRKALYIFLSSLLGMLLLLMFHRAVFVIYDILGSFYPSSPWLNMSAYDIYALDFLSMLVAMFVGGWYGVWLGMNWYHMIYEERGVKTWFHGFVPHRWRSRRDGKEASDFLGDISAKGTSVLPKKIVVNSSSNKSHHESFRTFRTAKLQSPSPAWNVDDLSAEEPAKTTAKKRVVRKKAVSKIARKVVAKKKTEVTIE